MKNANEQYKQGRKTGRRWIAGLLSLLLCWQLLPVTAMADPTLDESKQQADSAWTEFSAAYKAVADVVQAPNYHLEDTCAAERDGMADLGAAYVLAAGDYYALLEKTAVTQTAMVSIKTEMQEQLTLLENYIKQAALPEGKTEGTVKAYPVEQACYETVVAAKEEVLDRVAELLRGYLKTMTWEEGDQESTGGIDSAWEAIEEAENAYFGAVETVQDFCDKFYDNLFYYGGTPEKIYHYEAAGKTADYVQESLTWTCTDVSPEEERTDITDYAGLSNAISREFAQAKELCDQTDSSGVFMKTELNALISAWKSFYWMLPGELGPESWQGLYDRIRERTEIYEQFHVYYLSIVEVIGGKAYSTRFPHYAFDTIDGLGSLPYAFAYDGVGMNAPYQKLMEGENAYLADSLEKIEALLKAPSEEELDEAKESVRKTYWNMEKAFQATSWDETAAQTAKSAADTWSLQLISYASMCYNNMSNQFKDRLPLYTAEKLRLMGELYEKEWETWRTCWETEPLYVQNGSAPQENYYRQALSGRIKALERTLSLLDQLIPKAEDRAEKFENPYSEERIEALSDAELGVQVMEGISRKVATRNYLRARQAELQVWCDVAQETVNQAQLSLFGEGKDWLEWMTSPVKSDDPNSETETSGTIANTYDIRLTALEAKAVVKQLEAYISDLDDAYEEFNAPDEVGSSAQAEEEKDVGRYSDLLAQYEQKCREYEEAAAQVAEKKAALDDMPETIAGEVYSEARAAYDQALKTQSDLEKAVNTLREDLYVAAKKDAQTWLEQREDLVTKWSTAYRTGRYNEAKAAYEEVNAQWTLAKQETTDCELTVAAAKEAMDASQAEANMAMTAYSGLVTQLIQAQADMNTAEKNQGTSSEAYISAKAAFEKLDSETSAASEAVTETAKDLGQKSKTYNEAVAASEAAVKNEADLKTRTGEAETSYKALREQMESGVDVFSKVVRSDQSEYEELNPNSLQVRIDTANEYIDACYVQFEESYLLFTGQEFNRLSDMEKGEAIFLFRQSVSDLAGYTSMLKSLEAALATKFAPKTLDSATYAAQEAAQNYYYALREYDEYKMLDQTMLKQLAGAPVFSLMINGSVSTERDKYGYRTGNGSGKNTMAMVSSLNALQWVKAANAILPKYEAYLEDLKEEADKAKADMDEKLAYLFRMEIVYEKKLKTEEAINQRANMLAFDYNSVRTTQWEPIEKQRKDLESALNNQQTGLPDLFTNQSKDIFFDLAQMRPSEADENIQEYREDFGAFLSAYGSLWGVSQSTTVGTLVDWMNLYGSDTYRNIFTDLIVKERLATDEGGQRSQTIARIQRLGDQYALQVNTGATNGNGVLFFSVVYTDTDGFERKEYIFPFLDAYKNTLDDANATMAENADAEEIEKAKALGTYTETDVVSCAVNQDHINTMAMLGQAGDIKATTPLAAWSSDAYLFHSQYKMAKDGDGEDAPPKFSNFEMFTQRQDPDADGNVSGEHKNSWSCSGMRLFQVDDFFGLSVYGYGGSSQTRVQLEFKGKQIGALKSNLAAGGVISWVTDELHSLGAADDKSFSIDKTVTEYITGKVGSESAAGFLAKVSDEDSEYLFKLDFADYFDAGLETQVNFVTAPKSAETDPAEGGETTEDTETEEPGEPEEPEKTTPTVDTSTKDSIRDMGLAECLTFRIVYRDNIGARRQVDVPVVTSALAWAVDHGADPEQKIFGFAQQDESIVFSAYLPEMSELSLGESTIIFDAVQGWPQSGAVSSRAKENFKTRQKLFSAKDKDTGERFDSQLLLAGMQVYAPGTYTASASVEQGVIVPTVTGDPMYYQTAASGGRGLQYKYGSTVTPTLSKYVTGAQLTPAKSQKTKYMLVIDTDTPEMAGTKLSPSIELNYTTKSGRSAISPTANVAENGRDFFGYWPGVDNVNITVDQATGAGGQLKLIYEIDDLKNFDSVRITLPENNGEDDWQVNSLYIMQLTEVGKRFAIWENIYDPAGNFKTDRRYDRTVKGVNVTQPTSVKTLIQPGESKLITFENGTEPTPVTTEIDWEKVRYYMDAETAQGMLGFTKERAAYTINVKVASEDASTVSDGDCGSVNNFYFQLIFANGRSAYILANQQLTGDGFRTGYNETFKIRTNRDYGELQAVRIIPDDNSKDSELFDKLCIERISVSRDSDDAVSRTWVVEDIGNRGWISFDYHDDAESYGILGRPGRSEADMCVNCPVGYATYSTKLLFALSTSQVNSFDVEAELDELLGEDDDQEKRDALRKILLDNPQYQGEMSMILHYRNSKGNIEPLTIDVVDAMAAYYKKTVSAQDIKDPATGKTTKSTQKMSRTDYMFRVGHTDRFEVDVQDIVELTDVDIIATGASTQATFWNVSALSVSLLKEAGVLNINVNNEYEKTNAQTAELLCTAENMPFEFYCPADNPEKMNFSFTANRLNVDTTTQTWEVSPARVPESSNDTANIYVYLRGAGTFVDTAEYNLVYSQLQYTTSYGQVYKAPMRQMAHVENIDGEGNALYFTTGVDIPNVSVLNKLMVRLNSSNNLIIVDHIVVQQIRSDVVVATYIMKPGEVENTVGGSTGERYFVPGTGDISGTMVGTRDKQIVTVGFGPNTDTARLVNENRDIALALRYTSTNDVADNSVGKREYNSPYIYLTDQDIIAINAGGTAQITFHEQCVDEIVGVVALATGGLKAELEMASIELYQEVYSGNTTEYAHPAEYWYNIVEGGELTPAGHTFRAWKMNTEGQQQEVVSPFTMEISTGEEAPTGALKMTVTYQKIGFDGEFDVVIDNIRNNLVSGGFAAGQDAVVRVMLKNVEKVLKVTLEPVRADDVWSITSLKTTLDRTGKGVKAKDKTAMLGAPAVYDVKVIDTISLIVTANSGAMTQSSNQAGAMVFRDVAANQTVTMTASAEGVEDDINVKAERQSGEEWIDVTNAALTLSEGKWVFQASRSDELVYRVTFTLANHPDINETVTIYYNGTAQEQEDTPTDEEQEEPAPEPTPQPVQVQSAPASGGQGIKLNHALLTLTAAAGQYQLNEVNGKTVTWSSSDNSLATVENGLVKAAPGSYPGASVTITARGSDGSTASCTVSFKAAEAG